jgi:multicomponent Na+:H+ antiporter subunit G
MSVVDAVALGLVLLGAAFFLAGTVGLLRFPDVHARLHALTKADNVGLGILALGLAVAAGSAGAAAKLLAIWLLALLASTGACYLIARGAYEARERGE